MHRVGLCERTDHVETVFEKHFVELLKHTVRLNQGVKETHAVFFLIDSIINSKKNKNYIKGSLDSDEIAIFIGQNEQILKGLA